MADHDEAYWRRWRLGVFRFLVPSFSPIASRRRSSGFSSRRHLDAGLCGSGHAGEVRQGRGDQGRALQCEECPGAGARNLGRKRLLRAARQVDRLDGGGWQVWSVERRENLLEDQSVLNLSKQGKATATQLYDYYLGYLKDPSVKQHYQSIPNSTVEFAKQWGMNVAVQDLHAVIDAAKRLGGRVVLGGHSLGGSVVTAYATWDFNGHAGAETPAWSTSTVAAPQRVNAQKATRNCRRSTRRASALAIVRGDRRALRRAVQRDRIGRVLVPNSRRSARLRGCSRRHRAAGPGHQRRPVRLRPQRLDVAAEPDRRAGTPRCRARRRRSGPRLERRRRADPDRPLRDDVLGYAMNNVDGTEWYFPQRLTDDTGGSTTGTRIRPRRSSTSTPPWATRSQDPADLCLRRPPRRRGVVAAAGAGRSPTSRRYLTLVNRQSTYAHNDPAGAYPTNDFFDHLVPFLKKIGSHG